MRESREENSNTDYTLLEFFNFYNEPSQWSFNFTDKLEKKRPYNLEFRVTKKEEKEKYPYAEWEKKRELVKKRLRKLPEYVREAVAMIRIQKKAGKQKEIDLEKRVMLFLFARLMNRSNRDIEELLESFEPLFGLKVSYKTIERLYCR
ncbi:hypothetical protein AIOGIFDO_02015 [Candidatus Methanoperedenaceae archaeon GB37]|nr:hypothetical protein AIOGIFDO_02015 [Candidatus Methanoperedenaceae archaeon GB37]